jgi:hypothetical protein
MRFDTNQTLRTIEEIAQRQLITSGTQPAGQYAFWGNDTEQQYRDNAQRLGSDWYWLARPVTYTVNSQNYRCPEWRSIDWVNSVVLYGCSFVFGDGISDEDTISSQLSRLIDRPVINLGAGGSSPRWQLDNQTLVLKWFAEPWASITIWPCASRSLSYEYANTAHRWGSWNIHKNNWTDHWNRGTNPGTQIWMTREQSRRMHRRRWLDATFSENIAELLKIPCLRGIETDSPSARDLAHPGPETARRVAEYLAEQLT